MSSNEEAPQNIIGDKETSKFIVYTVDSTEFHLLEFNQYDATGKMENGDKIQFHPENIIAIRTKQNNSSKL